MLPSVGAFLRDRTVRHSSLVVPVRVLWDDYSAYCRRWGFERSSATSFVALVAGLDGVRVRDGGHGRLRRIATGIGALPRTVDKVA